MKSSTSRVLGIALAGAIALASLGVMGCSRTGRVASSTTPSASTTSAELTPGTTPATSSANPTAPTNPQPVPTVAPLKPMRPGTLQPPATGAYLGLFRPKGPFIRADMDSYATISPKRPSVIMWYQQWGSHGPNQFDMRMVADVYKRGAIPMISWEPWDPGSKPHNIKNPADSPDWNLQSIIDGKHDAYLRSWAQRVKTIGGPVILRPAHEMNGNWYPWSGTANGNTPALYIAAWRHIRELFDRAGVKNATWMWSVNVNSKPNTPDNAYSVYYPGDDYVDWVGVSGFNAGTNHRNGMRNMFDELFNTPLAYLSTLGKPIAICESASVERDADKAAWITDAYHKLQTEHTEVKLFVYYDAFEKGVIHGVQDFRIASSPASKKAYQDAIAPSYFVAAPSPTLSSWLNGLSAGQRNRLWSYPKGY